MKKIYLVGKGKLANHLNTYFSYLSYEVYNWSRSQFHTEFPDLVQNKSLIENQKQSSTDAFQSCSNTKNPKIHDSFTSISNFDFHKKYIVDLKNKIQCDSPIFLAISDSALELYINDLKDLKNPIFHFSGANSYKQAIGLHPMMAFSHRSLSLSEYQKIHFSIDHIDFNLQQYFPELSNSFSYIPPEQKAYYHALCVSSANFPILIWQKCQSEFANLGLPDSAMAFYIEQNLKNYLYQNDSLTGPIARKDFSTIQKNLNSLQNSELQNIYSAFVQSFCKEYPHEHS